jgi:protein-tyrosine-phosphatase
VLFICQFGTVKSAIAREMTRRRAAELRIPLHAISRGITPQNHISQHLAERLRVDGIDPARDPVRALDAETLRVAQVVVLLDTLPANLRRPDALDWRAVPSFNDDYGAAKAFITVHIDELLSEIQQLHLKLNADWASSRT